MERCPNCGAPARIGAKFCTTCGFRLPEAASESPPAATTVDPPADDVVVDNGWPAPAAAMGGAASWPPPADADPAEQRPADDAETADEVVVAGARVIDPFADARDEPPLATDGDAEPPSAPAMDWGWPRGASDESALDPGERSAPTEDQAASPWAPAADEGEEPVVPSLDAGVVVEEEGIAAPAEVAMVVASAAGAGGGGGGASPTAERALALLDELRALIPALSAGPAPDAARIADDLEAAVAQGPDLGGLRAAMEGARERPRDIDTVLDLVGRVDAVIALIDVHDRAVDAMAAAIVALRGGRPAPAPVADAGIEEDATGGDATA